LPPIYTGQIQHHHHPCSGSTFQNMAATFECSSSSRFSRFLQRKNNDFKKIEMKKKWMSGRVPDYATLAIAEWR
jgi:hypothetical protein